MTAPPTTTPDSLTIATHNRGKMAEFVPLLAPHRVHCHILKSPLPPPAESGSSFAQNAAIKARAARVQTPPPILADDSGLCIDALDGKPGIHSARWAGKSADFSAAMARIIDRLATAGQPDPSACTARFVAVLAVIDIEDNLRFFTGVVHGTLRWPMRGTRNFGYDPFFVPLGDERTYAEFSESEKNFGPHRSHRARAVDALAQWRQRARGLAGF